MLGGLVSLPCASHVLGLDLALCFPAAPNCEERGGALYHSHGVLEVGRGRPGDRCWHISL